MPAQKVMLWLLTFYWAPLTMTKMVSIFNTTVKSMLVDVVSIVRVFEN